MARSSECKADGTVRILLRRRSRFIVNDLDFGLQKGTIFIYAEEFEALAAFSHKVEPSVGILFYNGHNLGGASHLGETLLRARE